jgi:mycoredoxin
MSEDKQIIVYGTKWCPDCHRSKKVLRQREIPFEYVDINHDAEARAYVEQVNHGNRSVPTILFPDGDVLVEPSNSALSAKLDALYAIDKS